jgi:hypothetical protein
MWLLPLFRKTLCAGSCNRVNLLSFVLFRRAGFESRYRYQNLKILLKNPIRQGLRFIVL